MSCDTKDTLLSYICDQIQLCMLPALKENLDGEQLLPEHFENFHSLLSQELPKLYDLLQQNEDIFLNENQYQPLKAQLVVLLCELTAHPTAYRLGNEAEYLLQNAELLLKKLFSSSQTSEDPYIFNYYEKKLHKDCWKRQLGAVNGFMKYLEHQYVDEVKMSKKMLTFGLAVGINVRECYLPNYKLMGVGIFSRMLDHSNAADIRQLNIHEVIYEQVFKDAYNFDTVEATTATWNCLCRCLDYFTEIDPFTWNKSDDMLERLTANVSLTNDVEITICLMHFIAKISYYFTLNRSEVSEALAKDFTQPDQLVKCRQLCASLNVCTSYRWAKSLLKMLVLESGKLLQGPEACAQILGAMQRCYLVCILPIPLNALCHHVFKFYRKFLPMILKSLDLNKKAQPIQSISQQFIETFIYQLKCYIPESPDSKPITNVSEFVTAMEKVIDNRVK